MMFVLLFLKEVFARSLCLARHKWTPWNNSYERYYRLENQGDNDYIAEKWQKRTCLRCTATQMKEIK